MKNKTVVIMAVVAGVLLIGIVVVAFVGFGAGAYLLSRDADRGPYLPPFRADLAMDGAVIFARQGFPDSRQPFELRGTRVTGDRLERVWHYSHQGQGVTDWTTAGPWAAGLLIMPGPRTTALLFHRERGFVREFTGPEIAVALIDRDELLVRTGGDLALYRLNAPSTALWTAPIPPGAYVVQFGYTDQHVLAFNDSVGLHVYPRAGGAVAVIASVHALAGLSRQRAETILLRDGRLEVVPIGASQPRIALDLGQGRPLTDSMEDPCLLGRHGNDWIFVYTTGMDTSHSSNATQWMEAAERTVAAVDAQSGEVRWRYTVGPWVCECYDIFGGWSMPEDVELPDTLLVYGQHDRRGGGGKEGFLLNLDLTNGTARWRAEFGDAFRTPILLRRFSSGALFHLQDPSAQRPLLARFDGGRLVSAAAFSTWAQADTRLANDDTVWVNGLGSEAESWTRLDARTLRPQGPTGASAVRDARSDVARLLSLPAQAR